MYYYIYHQDVRRQKFQKRLTALERKVNSLGLQGKNIHSNSYSSVDESLKKIFSETTESTLVVVGDDELFSKTLSVLVTLSAKPTVGYIPFFKNTQISESLGISCGEDAIMTLARRRIETIYIPRINDDIFFVSHLEANCANLSITVNKKYSVKCESDSAKIRVANMPLSVLDKKTNSNINPCDMFLELVVIEESKRGALKRDVDAKISGFFSCEDINIQSNEQKTVIVDGFKEVQTPVRIESSPHQIKLIVGKSRMF